MENIVQTQASINNIFVTKKSFDGIFVMLCPTEERVGGWIRVPPLSTDRSIRTRTFSSKAHIYICLLPQYLAAEMSRKIYR